MNAAPTHKKDRYHHGDLRAELLVAAEAELNASGLEAFSLRAVAKRAGVSHGAPAHHFSDVKGLLTALAVVGNDRFVAAQVTRQQEALADPLSQLVASGVGYVDFAVENPALFRLIFTSTMPDKTDPEFCRAADAAYEKLVTDVAAVTKGDPRSEPNAGRALITAWSVVHGLADLTISGRLQALFSSCTPPRDERSQTITGIIRPLFLNASN